jgi:hypothetical protein
MKLIISYTLIMLLVMGSQVLTQIIEIHEFGETNVQHYIYSDGITWEFKAENTMIVDKIEVKSVLASNGGTFHIEISIQDSLIAKWDQYVNDTQYKPYIHTKQVSYSLSEGDTIVYKIYGNQFWTPEGGLLGINHVKIIGREITLIEINDTKPSLFQLSQNYPNPFNSATTIEFNVKQKGPVSLKVYDIHGGELMTLIDQVYNPGHYLVRFNGESLPSGIYIYRIQMNGLEQVRKMTLIK